MKPSITLQKWAGLAAILMVAAVLAAHYVYLTGELETASGPLAYSLADFLYGTVWSAGLVVVVYAVRERIGDRAPRPMNLALLLALAAACAFLTVASIRSANRGYHLARPDLQLQSLSSILTVWTTLVTGVLGAAWHFLGWALVLTGWAGWATRGLPRALSGLYVVAGAVALPVYLFPGLEGAALLLVIAAIVWQGVVFLRGAPEKTVSDRGTDSHETEP